MSSLAKPHKRSFLRKQESRKTKENTGFPLKDCGNDGKSNVLLLMVFLVSQNYHFTLINDNFAFLYPGGQCITLPARR